MAHVNLRHRRWERLTGEDYIRYYEVHLEQDLFGTWVLTRVWGRRGSRLGQVRHQPLADVFAGEALLETIARERQRRGYVMV